jgi:hypothetical protein
VNRDSTNASGAAVTGKMREGFLQEQKDWWLNWHLDLDDERRTVALPKIYVAHSVEADMTALRFNFGSHLLVYDPTYSYFSYCGDRDLAGPGHSCELPLSYPPEYDVALGLPKGAMSLRAVGDARPGILPASYNASFESQLSGWTQFSPPGTGTVDTVNNAGAPDQSWSIHFRDTDTDPNAPRPAVYGGCIDITGMNLQNPLALSAWVKGNGLVSGPDGDIAVGFNWYSDAGCNSKINAPGNPTPILNGGSGTYDWRYVTSQTPSKPPSNAIRAQVYPVGLLRGTTGEAWVDDVRVLSVDPNSFEYAVFGRDFSSGTVLVNPGRGSVPVAGAPVLPYPHIDLDGNVVGYVALQPRQSAILRGDRVGDWSLDSNTNGIAQDASMAGHLGSVNLGTAGNTNLAAAVGAGHRAGQFGYVFDGVDDYVSFGNNTHWNVSSGDYSISAWFKTTWAPIAGSTILRRMEGTAGFALYVAYSNPSPIVFLQETDGQPCMLTTGPNGADYASQGNPAWHHVAVVVRQQRHSCELWVDGGHNSTGTFTGNMVDYDGPLTVSYPPNQGYQAFGSLDEVKLYRRALTSAEIATLFAQ